MTVRTTAVALVAVAGSMLAGGVAAADAPDPAESDGRPGPQTILGAPGSDTGFVGNTSFPEAPGVSYFIGNDAEHGAEPWVTDGTVEGTRMIADIRPGPTSSRAGVIGVWGDRLLVGAPFLDESTNLNVVDPDGTVTFIHPELRQPSRTSGDRRDILAVGDLLYFTADGDIGSNDAEPWVTDGTAGGTRQLADVNVGRLGSSPGGYGVVDGQLVFAASTEESGRELWTTDGTAAGTRMIADQSPGVGDSIEAEMLWVGERLFYVGVDAEGSAGSGRELWTSDGTADGTRRVVDLTPGSLSTNPQELTALGDKVVFNGPGSNPWVSDGTAVGTFELIRPNAGPGGSDAANFKEWGPAGRRQVMFTAATGFDYTARRFIHNVFTTDGTVAGSRQVADLSSPAHELGAVFRPWRDRVVMALDSGSSTVERLWVTDGTPQGTWPFTPPSPYLGGFRLAGDHAVWPGPSNTKSNGTNTIESLVSLQLDERTTAPSTWTPPVVTPPTTGTPTAPAPTTPTPTVPAPTTPTATVPVRSDTSVSLTGRYPNARAVVFVATAGRPATGTVAVTVDGRTVGTATLTRGSASLRLPSWVQAGRHQLAATYRGTTTVAPSTRSATSTVAKATSKVRATVARRQTIKRRAVLRVTVSSAAPSKAGRLEVRRGSKVVARGKAGAGGRVTVRLPRMRAGSHRLVIRWSGNTQAGASKDAVRVRVRR